MNSVKWMERSVRVRVRVRVIDVVQEIEACGWEVCDGGGMCG